VTCTGTQEFEESRGKLLIRESVAILFLTLPLLAQQTELAQQGDDPPVESTPQSEIEYGGPAILSRGAIASLRMPSRSIRFRPYLFFTSVYDTGITPVAVNSAGEISTNAGRGRALGIHGIWARRC